MLRLRPVEIALVRYLALRRRGRAEAALCRSARKAMRPWFAAASGRSRVVKDVDCGGADGRSSQLSLVWSRSRSGREEEVEEVRADAETSELESGAPIFL